MIQAKKLRILQRDLSKEQIEQTVRHPDERMPSFRGRSLAQKRFGSRILEVVHRRPNGDTIIITAYWLKEKEA